MGEIEAFEPSVTSITPVSQEGEVALTGLDLFDESVTVTNQGSQEVDLGGYVIHSITGSQVCTG